MKLSVLGSGYVGLTTSVVLAAIGHEVVTIDVDEKKINSLNSGKVPIHEPGLEELIAHVIHKNVHFTTSFESISDSEVIIIAVGTPQQSNGKVDTSYVENSIINIVDHMVSGRAYVVVVKSTVPVGTNKRVKSIIERELNKRQKECTVSVVSNPEFLREGKAVYDSFYPERLVVGATEDEGFAKVKAVFARVTEREFQHLIDLKLVETSNDPLPLVIQTTPTSAEVIKYAANAFLAVKISFINEIAGLCEKVGADVQEVAHGIGTDSRIGTKFLQAGIGWGGSCFPKDSNAIIGIASEYNYRLPIIEASRVVNNNQIEHIVNKVQERLKIIRGRNIGILGMAFKANTDDTRESQSLKLVDRLLELDAHLLVHDVIADLPTKYHNNPNIDVIHGNIQDQHSTLKVCDLIVIATEWPEYRDLDWEDLLNDGVYVLDARNLVGHQSDTKNHVRYMGLGR